MEYTLDEDKEEKDFFGGDSEYFRFDKKNSATVKKNEKNDVKLNEFKEDLEEIDMRSKSELNDDNKQSKINFENELKKGNNNPIIFISKKTLRNEPIKENKDNKNIKKNKKKDFKIKTEIDNQNTKQKMQFDFDIYNYFNNGDDNYFDIYEEPQNPDKFQREIEEFDIKTNTQKKHPYTTIDKNNITKNLDMASDSEGNTQIFSIYILFLFVTDINNAIIIINFILKINIVNIEKIFTHAQKVVYFIFNYIKIFLIIIKLRLKSNLT